jgi:hypothetical protein
MDWKEQLNKAAAKLQQVAESEQVKKVTAKARQTATDFARRAKRGAVSAADAFSEADSDASALTVRYLSANIRIMSPSDGLQVTRPHAGALLISDGQGNGLVIDVAADTARLAETVGTVKLLSDTAFDLGTEDGVNVIVLKG